MAVKRMFLRTLITCDEFTEMPLSSQALYFHLSLEADDRGFVNNPKSLMRSIRATEDDLKILIIKKFILVLDSGVLVIRHWHLNNSIRKDRLQETIYIEEFNKFSIIKGVYEYSTDNQAITTCQPLDNQVTTTCQPNDRVGKYSIDKYKDIVVHDNSCKEKIPYKKIIDYLNLKTKTNFKHTTKSTKQKIRARFNEGFTEQDFYDVIDIKTKEWLSNENMCQYLRPDTLFGTKFESYLNQNNILQPNITNQVFDYDLPSIDQVGDLF